MINRPKGRADYQAFKNEEEIVFQLLTKVFVRCFRDTVGLVPKHGEFGSEVQRGWFRDVRA